jgi:hypothetical protein
MRLSDWFPEGGGPYSGRLCCVVVERSDRFRWWRGPCEGFGEGGEDAGGVAGGFAAGGEVFDFHLWEFRTDHDGGGGVE